MHVLFVHGVGRHSRLSALMRAYQSLRADTRCPEAPVHAEDPIPTWKLTEFAEDGDQCGQPRLELRHEGEPGAVYFYEVNYSELAGVIRSNHRLDLTTLFVGLDLAINMARARLKNKPPLARAGEPDHRALAMVAQRAASVLVAATVPVLGLPSLLLRRFTANFVAVYSRFFEDIATFALDRNGNGLIAAHVDRTVRQIVSSSRFMRRAPDGPDDRLMIAAHSLGSVVAHDHQVRHRYKGDGSVLAETLLTYGSPIGMVCWLWLLLDFERMDFNDPRTGPFFTWSPELEHGQYAATQQRWLNVVNHLDPIATAFALEHAALGLTRAQNTGWLRGGKVQHRYIRAGRDWMRAHTAYFDRRLAGDRPEDTDGGFVEMLLRAAGLRPGAPEAVNDPNADGRHPSGHWREARDGLHLLRVRAWAAGLAVIAVLIGASAWLSGSALPLVLLPVYAVPKLTIGTLAGFQRLVYSRPSKRIAASDIGTVPWSDWHALPHRLRQALRRGLDDVRKERALVFGPGPGFLARWTMRVLAAVPTLIGAAAPLTLGAWHADAIATVWARIAEGPFLVIAGGLGLFSAYSMAFALSELAGHWREAVRLAAEAVPSAY